MRRGFEKCKYTLSGSPGGLIFTKRSESSWVFGLWSFDTSALTVKPFIGRVLISTSNSQCLALFFPCCRFDILNLRHKCFLTSSCKDWYFGMYKFNTSKEDGKVHWKERPAKTKSLLYVCVPTKQRGSGRRWPKDHPVAWELRPEESRMNSKHWCHRVQVIALVHSIVISVCIMYI